MLYLDCETRSSTPINHGLAKYFADPDFKILLISWAIDDGPVQVTDLTIGDVPQALKNQLKNPKCTVVAHNSTFERLAFKAAGIADIATERFHDTMVQAYAHGLPASLGLLSEAFKLGEDLTKHKSGKQLISLFCSPNRQGEFVNPAAKPLEWEEFKAYAASDITSMRQLLALMPRVNYPNIEHELWVIDQAINDRGIPIDVEMATACIETSIEERKRLDKKVNEETAGMVNSATQRDKLIIELKDTYGMELPDLRASTIERRLGDSDLPAGVRLILETRLQASQNAASKYNMMLKHEVDGRVRYTLQMYGASRTGRDAGRIIQPQNLKRPTLWKGLEGQALDAAIERDISLIKKGMLDLVYPDNVMEVLGNCVRSAIKAPDGFKLVQSDLSNIEGRALVWLSGETWKLNFFHDFDAGRVQYDNYVAAYAAAFNVDPETVTKSQRQIGKVMELGLGYGGGVGAFVTFVNTYNMDLDDLADNVEQTALASDFAQSVASYGHAVANGYSAGLSEKHFAACDYLKRKWRLAHPETVAFWHRLEDSFIQAVHNEGRNIKTGLLTFRRQGPWLFIRLPSGRCLVYANPKVVTLKAEDEGFGDYRLTFMGAQGYSGKWGVTETYYGKLAENVTSAVARDVLLNRMPDIEQAGYEIIMRVHDEFVTLAPDTDEYSHEKLSKIITQPYPWSEGLPLAAAGFEAYRYRKD